MDTKQAERPVRDVASPLTGRLLGAALAAQGPEVPEVLRRILERARLDAVEVASFSSSI